MTDASTSPEPAPPGEAGVPGGERPARGRLSRARILEAAIELVDEGGLDALSMRRLGQAVGVEAMSLYNHVRSKDDLIGGLIDLVTEEMEVAVDEADWRAAMAARARRAHEVLVRHPWAASLIESNIHPSPARLGHCESAIRILRRAGFTLELAYHAFLTLDSFVYGFTLQEVSWPFDADERPELIESLKPTISADDFPNIGEMMSFVAGEPRTPGAGYSPEFEFGLDLILGGLERALAASQGA